MYLETAEKCNRVENRGAIADRHPAGDIRSYYCPVHAMLNSARMCRGYKLEGSQDRERNPGCVGMIVPCGPCWDGVCISCAQGPWEPIGVPCPVSTRSPRPPPATEAEAAERAWRPSSPASRLRPAVALPELPAPAPVPRELLAHDEVVADKRARDEDSEDEERDRPAKKKKPSTRKRVVAREDEHPGLRRSARTKGRK